MIPDVTVVMPTYNRRRALEAVWPSYADADGVARIIVVDDAGTDGTGEMVARMTANSRVPTTYIRRNRKGTVQESKMAGVQAADTEWVLFGEDDVYLGTDYVSTLRADAIVTNA